MSAQTEAEFFAGGKWVIRYSRHWQSSVQAGFVASGEASTRARSRQRRPPRERSTAWLWHNAIGDRPYDESVGAEPQLPRPPYPATVRRHSPPLRRALRPLRP